MPLTPEDVSNKRFTPVRLREGYDMGEVDQFLDEVEAELERLHKEADDLRAKLAAAGGDGSATAPSTGSKATTATEEPESKPEAAAEKAPEATPEPVVEEAPRETIKVVTAAEASSAALRLLELATKNADEVVAEAKEEAEQIVVTARTEAERLQSETKARTDSLEEEARTRAQNLDAETETKRRELLGDMERERTRLDGEVENLRAFEREYRSRLKSYFTEQLQALDGTGDGGDLSGSSEAGEPKRLRSILGDRAGSGGTSGDAATTDAASTDAPGDAPQA